MAASSVSGVIGCFRKTALHRAGYWSTDMITEDIDLTWRLQLDHWSVLYEPNAMCWILMPETLKGLWRQRLRWAQGGVEVILRYAGAAAHELAHARMWPVFIEYLMSLIWAYVAGRTARARADRARRAAAAGLARAEPVAAVARRDPRRDLPDSVRPEHERSTVATSPASDAISIWMVWYPIAYWFLGVLTSVIIAQGIAEKTRHASSSAPTAE